MNYYSQQLNNEIFFFEIKCDSGRMRYGIVVQVLNELMTNHEDLFYNTPFIFRYTMNQIIIFKNSIIIIIFEVVAPNAKFVLLLC